MDKSLIKSIFAGVFTCVLGILTALIMAGCQDTFVDEPSIVRATTGGSVTELSVPKNVTATQGGFESVTVSWTGCNAASRYYVYSAESTSDTFERCNETKGNQTSISITESAGITKYYRVTAVKYDGTESSLSAWCKGTTISKPVITSITKDDDTKSATLTWWMENCYSGTYLSTVNYLIEGIKGTATTASLSATVDGSYDSYTFTDLEGKTDYSFTVSAYTVTDGVASKSEVSTAVSIQTAHRLIPLAPVDLTATQGTSKSEVTVSWKLPALTDAENNDGTYTETPNYFAVYRKLSSASDSAYELVQICATNTDKRKINGTESELTPVAFGTYIEGQTVSFTDSLEEGKNYGVKYDYKVKSYVDSTSPVTSSLSESSATGWLVSKPSLSTSAEYETDNDETNPKFTSATVTFNAQFDTLQLNDAYSFVLEESRTDLENDETVQEGWPVIACQSNSVSSACKAKTFDDMTQKGYYRYTLYVIPRVESDSDYENYASSAIISVQADGKITITDDMSAIPQLDSVKIEDGYKDCFKLTWKYDGDCIYILNWTTDSGATGTYTLTADDVYEAVDGSDFTFIHKGGSDETNDPAIVSGEKRTYTVTADKGITKTVTALLADSENSLAETLGTAVPEMYDNDYKTVTVRWPVVQKATSYELSAKMKDSETVWNFTPSDEEKEEINGVSYITYVLTDTENYGNAALSGLPVTFTVDALNSSTSDYTSADLEICTVGPAQTSPAVNGINKDYIEYTWKKAEGAAGYLVHRGIKVYDDSASAWKDSTNFISYYISSDCSTVEAGGEERSSDCVEVTYDETSETYTLKDKAYESTAENPGTYDFSQAAISWGVPFTYYVVPVKKGISDMTVDTTSAVHTIGIKGEAAYTNLTAVTGSTYGYGQNVMASKCESDSEITISWVKPYQTPSAPNIYYRKADSTENSWNRIMKATPAITDTSITFDFEKYFETLSDYTSDSKYEGYEYAVAYYTTDQTGYKIPSSFVNDSSNSGLSSIELTDDNKRYSYTTGHNPEKKNKGYLLSIKPLTAQYGGTDTANLYREMVNWEDWDFTERGIGPTSYSLYIKNKNLINADYKDEYGTTGWVKILSLGEDCRVSNFESEKAEALTNDMSFENLNNQLTIDATSLTNGPASCTNGLLKVLRDARHYYELVAKTSETYTASGHDESVYAYRQVTDEELVKSAMLALNDGLYQIGKFDFEKETHSDGNNVGTVYGYHNATFQIGKEYDITFTNYCPAMTSPEGSVVSMLKVNSSLVGYRNSTTSGSYPVSFDSTSIKVAPYYSDMPSSYTKTISFSLSSSSSASISCGSCSLTINTDDLRRTWIPWQLNNDSWYHLSTTYGWWPEN